MPWHIDNRDGDYCVIKDDDGSVAGCHDTRAEAEAQMAALYASEGAKAEFRQYTYNGVTVQATGRRTAEAEGKKYERTVRDGDTERTVAYGSPDMPMRRTNEEARENFLSRHDCGSKKDPFAPGFWACYDWQNPSEKAVKQDAWYDFRYRLDGQKPTIGAIDDGGVPIKAVKSGVLDIELPDGLLPGEREDYVRVFKRVLNATGDAIKAQLAAFGAVNRARAGYAVKAEKDGAGVVVSGWAILFGDPQHVDSDEQWFGVKTDFQLKRYSNAPLWLEHGTDQLVKSMTIGERVKTEVVPDHGIWVEHRLVRDEPAFDLIDFDQLVTDIKAGKYAYSSDSLLHHVQNGYKANTGELAVWPLAGISLVRRPAEPGLGPVITP